jgi:hypothetical protein
MDTDPDPGSPKTCGFGGCGSGFATLVGSRTQIILAALPPTFSVLT